MIQLSKSELNGVFDAVNAFALRFRQLPAGENVRQKMLTKAAKVKAGWYACIVNPNIDVLLLPEYFESRQSRNILLKKETEQYQQVLAKFTELRSISSHQGIYENLLADKQETVTTGFDLFSTQTVVVKEACPAHIVKMFNAWQQMPAGMGEFETLLMQFYDWHQNNHFSFSGQRHFVLWFNYRLWRIFGDGALLLNTEHFFYHHWNKESRDCVKSIRQLLSMIADNCVQLQAELRDVYREEIGYDAFTSEQKIINNHYFQSGFAMPEVTAKADDYSAHLLKNISRQGFVSSDDITFKTQHEKMLATLQYLNSTDSLKVVLTEDKWWVGIKPGAGKSSRLQQYCNIEFRQHETDWSLLQQMVQPVKLQPVKKAEEPAVNIAERAQPRQKAFFG